MGHHEEEYYEDDGEFNDEEEELTVETEEQRRNRVIAVFSTSYGISIAVHVALILILLSIKIAVEGVDKNVKVIAKREVKPQPYDETKKRALKKTPEILAPETEEQPIIDNIEEIEPTKEKPRGTSFNNKSNKELDSDSANDAYGIGGGASGAYGSRFGKGSLIRNGGSPGTESAVTAALRWLKFHQSSDGSWDTDEWNKNCPKGGCKGPGENFGGSDYDVGVSSLALLAFLGNGNTHRVGTFKRTVNRGLRWLRQQQDSSGAIGYSRKHGESIYNHSIATMAMCETCYSITKDPFLKRYAEKSVEVLCVKSQNPNLGWKYGPRTGKNDTSVTGWMVLGLKAGKLAKLDVPTEAFTGARRWFDRVTMENGRVGYMNPDGRSAVMKENENKFEEVPCMTAVSVICRIFTGEPRSVDAIRKGAKILMKNPPNWKKGGPTKKVNFYYWYYATYAMFQFGNDPMWKQWNKWMQDSLLPTQRMGGCEDGSWNPVGEWCIAGGRVYATAINALTLEIYYRYERQGGS